MWCVNIFVIHSYGTVGVSITCTDRNGTTLWVRTVVVVCFCRCKMGQRRDKSEETSQTEPPAPIWAENFWKTQTIPDSRPNRQQRRFPTPRSHAWRADHNTPSTPILYTSAARYLIRDVLLARCCWMRTGVAATAPLRCSLTASSGASSQRTGSWIYE